MKKLFGIANFCKITLSKDTGEVIMSHDRPNITCTAGRASLAKRLVDSATAELGVIKYIAVGSSSQTAAEGLVKLHTEIARSTLEADRTILTGNQVKVYARFGVGTSLSISEAGVFVDSTATSVADSGSLLCYSTGFPPIVKNSTEVLTIEWTINVNNATI